MRKGLLLSFVLFCSAAFAVDDFDSYFKYLDQYPNKLFPKGNAQEGEIEIILDKSKMEELQKKMNRKVGVVADDKYWLWINDAVKFPNGTFGIYGRILWKQSLEGTPGVAVMPILPNGKIVLIRNFRHATRSWEYELPRGGINKQETVEAAAAREVKEETGMGIDRLHSLGNVVTDSGITSTVIPVFLAHVISEGQTQHDDSEAIAGTEAFTVDEIKKGFIDGYLSVKIDGKTQNIPLRDAFLTFALFQADIRHLLNKKSI